MRGVAQLPRVDVVISYAGADGASMRGCLAAGARGIVSAGFAPGGQTPGSGKPRCGAGAEHACGQRARREFRASGGERGRLSGQPVAAESAGAADAGVARARPGAELRRAQQGVCDLLTSPRVNDVIPSSLQTKPSCIAPCAYLPRQKTAPHSDHRQLPNHHRPRSVPPSASVSPPAPSPRSPRTPP